MKENKQNKNTEGIETQKIAWKCLTCGVLSEAERENVSQIFAMIIYFWMLY